MNERKRLRKRLIAELERQKASIADHQKNVRKIEDMIIKLDKNELNEKKENNDALKLWWVSWHQPTDDPRPIDFPPLPEILAWWISGEEASGRFTLCAYVQGNDEEEVKAGVLKHFPEAEDWRFCNQKDYIPSDRFPLPDWSPLNKKSILMNSNRLWWGVPRD